MSSTKNVANAVGAKTARACDSCIRKRARWFCAADDAFLCQACDSSVHSANPLARRHHRVRLNIDSYDDNTNCAPSWHRGFTKKPRTPRHGKHADKKASKQHGNPFDVVPEVCPEDTNSDSVEELLFRVPVCATPSSPEQAVVSVTDEGRVLFGCESAFEIEEFAADVKSLLGKGLESECVGLEELGLVGTKEVEEYASYVKVEEDAYELGFGCDDESNNVALACEEVKEKVIIGLDEKFKNGGEVLKENGEAKRKKMLLLRLDYEAVITAWASQKSPWTTGDKPDLGTQQCWPHCMCHYPYGELGGLFGCHSAMADGGREARVSRYREKRRTRLFSKKIRYEVRKLNAEKRPRMKGRFVKRASLVAPPTLPLRNK